jgi:hypothetical protein
MNQILLSRRSRRHLMLWTILATALLAEASVVARFFS